MNTDVACFPEGVHRCRRSLFAGYRDIAEGRRQKEKPYKTRVLAFHLALTAKAIKLLLTAQIMLK
ncbi:hypothetical protein NIES2119_28370 [[Phormidium ambiguum] IAM M-71]|uniref:Transposase DDE domain-containing protein n=1 Tax=[Phormidium ambiguum] IAM M-71 TaxID=454136 RepID=A0A1U7I5H1_9CYAN|nr:hypothetical protein [Phormidium ambiguum]OKH31525.1 hypothetical protein NIES2119_28370 [Phormidium ambiguum IAM M-71]